MTSQTELAWAAGFFDGEGHISLRNSGKGFKRIAVQAAQIDRQVLDRFQKAVGVGHVYGPYTPKAKTRKPYFGWQTTGGLEQAQHAIAMLWNWLSPVKKAQGKKALLLAKEYYSRPRLKPGPKKGSSNTLKGRTWNVIDGKRVWLCAF